MKTNKQGLYKKANLLQEDINHPERYGGNSPYECIKVLDAWLCDDEYKGFLRGNCLKYLCRLGKKDEEIKELEKAKWYLEKLIESYKGKKSWCYQDKSHC